MHLTYLGWNVARALGGQRTRARGVEAQTGDIWVRCRTRSLGVLRQTLRMSSMMTSCRLSGKVPTWSMTPLR